MNARSVLRRVHPVAGFLACAVILVFWTGTVAVELFGDESAVVAVKQAIPWGLLVLVPALACTGATGLRLGGRSRNPLVRAKKRRMPVIAAIGLLVLVPCALYLAALAGSRSFGAAFSVVQAVELLAGAVNLTLLGRSIRDGRRLRARTRRPAAPDVARSTG